MRAIVRRAGEHPAVNRPFVEVELLEGSINKGMTAVAEGLSELVVTFHSSELVEYTSSTLRSFTTIPQTWILEPVSFDVRSLEGLVLIS